jgi:ribosomal RNA-processing protein 9
VRLWKLDRALRSFAPLGALPAPGVVNALQLVRPPSGAGIGAEWTAADGDREGAQAPAPAGGKEKVKTPIVLIAALAREPRLGRWLVLKEGVQNRALVAVLPVR